MAKHNIVVATPCFGGLVTSDYTSSLIALIGAAGKFDAAVKVAFVAGDALITRARSLAVATFMDEPAATHMLFIDADISFQPDQVKRLLDVDVDMAAAMYPLKAIDWQRMDDRMARGEPRQEAALSYVGDVGATGDKKIKNGFICSDYAGTGFLMIKRQVLTRMFAAYPELRYRALDGHYPLLSNENLYALFDCVIDQATGKYLSEDYAFCKRWRDIGGELWLDSNSRLTHTGPTKFVGDTSRRYRVS